PHKRLAAPLPQAEHSPQTAAVRFALENADEVLALYGFRADSMVREDIAKGLAALAAPSGGQPPAALPANWRELLGETPAPVLQAVPGERAALKELHEATVAP